MEDLLDSEDRTPRVDKRSLALYAVTDRKWLGDRSLADCVEQAIAGGTTFVQLREKHADRDQVVDLAYKLKPICAAAGVPFIIDDSASIAAEVEADGVHVGQHDRSCEEARKIVGPDKIVGVSVQTVEQALKAQDDGADYLGVGALFATATKGDAVAVSIDDLRAICTAVDIPVVGIGGLNADTIPLLDGTGVDGAAVVSAIFGADDCTAAARQLRDAVDAVLATPVEESDEQIEDEFRRI